ncbi:MAG TPA: hypothetical protein VHL11_13640, partial [Phototrophicaceae bacterium]|nr:hypothetical protein [Phototrophicaceae bacterium]
GTVNTKVKVLVIYSTEAEKGKIVADVTASEAYTQISGNYTVTGDPISKVKIKIANKGTTGKVYFDDVSVLYNSGAGTFSSNAASGGLIPLP